MSQREPVIPPAFVALWIRAVTKEELAAVFGAVQQGDAHAVATAVAFVTAESFGIGHNRVRARLCRHFKNHPPPESAQRALVEAIASRLIEGRFAQQFKDQLALAIRFCPQRMAEAATAASRCDKAYLQNYARWVQQRLSMSSAVRNRV